MNVSCDCLIQLQHFASVIQLLLGLQVNFIVTLFTRGELVVCGNFVEFNERLTIEFFGLFIVDPPPLLTMQMMRMESKKRGKNLLFGFSGRGTSSDRSDSTWLQLSKKERVFTCHLGSQWLIREKNRK